MCNRFCVLLIFSFAVACGDDAVDFTGTCDAYKTMCSNDAKLQQQNHALCLQKCEQGGGTAPEKIEGCAFWYCAVETRSCDNQQPEDAAIMGCVKKHGWDVGGVNTIPIPI